MNRAVKKTISLPFDLAKEVEDIAREEGKTLRCYHRLRMDPPPTEIRTH
jgi:hypothetical protein